MCVCVFCVCVCVCVISFFPSSKHFISNICCCCRIIAETSTGCLIAGSALGKKGKVFSVLWLLDWLGILLAKLILQSQKLLQWLVSAWLAGQKVIVFMCMRITFNHYKPVIHHCAYLCGYIIYIYTTHSGVPAEKVGESAAQMLLTNLRHGGCVDEYLQDQVGSSLHCCCSYGLLVL